MSNLKRLHDLFEKITKDATQKKKEISKMLQYFIVQEIVTHKYWSMGIVVRSGGGPNNIWLFDRSLHDKDECLESKYIYTPSTNIL